MTENLRLKTWVENKLDSGVDPERVRESLNNTGRDPEIVDRVLKERNEPAKNPEQESEPESEPESKQESEIHTESSKKHSEHEKKEDKGIDLTPEKEEEKEEVQEKTTREESSKSKPEKIEEVVLKREKKLEQSLNKAHMPVKPVLVLLVIGLVGGGYTVLGNTDIDEHLGNPLSTTDWDEPREDCDLDSGFLITEAEQTENSVEAEVRVTSSPEDVVLEVFEGETRTGYTLESFEGAETLEVDATGDRLVFRPQGCENRYDDQDL